MEKPTKEELKALVEAYGVQVREACYEAWHYSGCRPNAGHEEKLADDLRDAVLEQIDALYAEAPADATK